nr:uncharacterized protein LOC125979818 [Syngnathus scovelli]XP_049594454.1 uncharacterized protein LOC125979818 [Syngnathus scovelli]
MHPSPTRKRNRTRFAKHDTFDYTRKELQYDSQSDAEGAAGGYDPTIKSISKKAEEKGRTPGKKIRTRTYFSSTYSGSDSSDDDGGDKDPTPTSCSTPTAMEDWRRTALMSIKNRKKQCLEELDWSVEPKEQEELEEQLQRLEVAERKLKKEASKIPASLLSQGQRSRRANTILPVLVRGQQLEYKPWQNSDMSAILEKLPTIQDGAHPWISKLEECMVGTQFAVGDIKRLLANVVGVHTMKDILGKAGLHRFATTSANDSDLFAAVQGQMWGALKAAYPTNANPDNIVLEPLGLTENARSYMARAYQTWRHITGNDPDTTQMEKSILRDKIQKGLPVQVRSKLAEVVGLGSMTTNVYTDHIAHQVDWFRKKEMAQKEQDQEVVRRLNQVQLVDNIKEKKQTVVVQAPPQQIILQPTSPHGLTPQGAMAVPFSPAPQWGNRPAHLWGATARGDKGRAGRPNLPAGLQQRPNSCYNCGRPGHMSRQCDRPYNNSSGGGFRGGIKPRGQNQHNR